MFETRQFKGLKDAEMKHIFEEFTSVTKQYFNDFCQCNAAPSLYELSNNIGRLLTRNVYAPQYEVKDEHLFMTK